jgi:Uma2 family endonuclease
MMEFTPQPLCSAYVRLCQTPSRAYGMGMPAHQSPHQPLWNADMVRSLPDDGNRYELIDGVLLVSTSPSKLHKRALLMLIMAIQS